MSDKDQIRVFFALRPDEGAVQQLLKRIDGLRSRGWEKCARFSGEQNLHLTLRFVGEVAPEALEKLLAGAKEIAAELRPFDYQIGGTTLFPRVSRARIVAAKIESPPPELKTLARRLDRLAVECGLAEEKFPYRPHITLARLQAAKSRPRLAAQGNFTIQQHASEFVIYRSTLNPEEAEYEPMESFPFGEQTG
ncbi:MAG: 2'-5' RNA ligase [Verrucomicrobiales bacterium]|jgi:2'-5' RNA ligase